MSSAARLHGVFGNPISTLPEIHLSGRVSGNSITDAIMTTTAIDNTRQEEIAGRNGNRSVASVPVQDRAAAASSDTRAAEVDEQRRSGMDADRRVLPNS